MNQDEKIDYIYTTLKKQESRYKWSVWTKWIFRILLVGYFYYSFVYLLPVYIENFKKSLTPEISSKISESFDSIDKEELINKFKSLLNN